jgi:hypothetical protein
MRAMAMGPVLNGALVPGFAGLFNMSEKINGQYRTGYMQDAFGLQPMMDQAVATHTNTRGINPQRLALINHVVCGCYAFIDCDRKSMLGGFGIVNRKNYGSRAIRQLTTQRVMGLDIANHPTTTMEIQQCRKLSLMS